MNIAVDPAALDPAPIEIDPRPCRICGLKIDRHIMVDDGEGPEFFCYPNDDLVTQWELADPRDAWRHTGEPPPAASVRNADISRPPATRTHYKTPGTTRQAFLYVVGLCDPVRLRKWLQDHPRDARYLLKLLETT